MQRRQFLHTGAALLGVGGVLHGDVRAATAYGPLGSVSVRGAKEAVVGDDGWVFLAVTDGYAVVDASDPASPEVVHETRAIQPDGASSILRGIWDVKYDAGRLLVASQGFGDGVTHGFLIVDVSDPTAPERVLFQETPYPIHNCLLDGDRAYLSGGEDPRTAVSIWDVSGSEASQIGAVQPAVLDAAWEQAFPDGGPGAHDMWVHDDLVFTASWDAGVFAVDVSEPSAPEFVSNFGGFDPETIAGWSKEETRLHTFRPPGNAHYVATNPSGDLVAVGGESWEVEGEGGPMGIDLYDVSDPASPEPLSHIEPPESPNPSLTDGVDTTAHNFELRDGVLYSSWYFGGVKRHDISDPANPREVTWWRHPGEASFWTARVLESGESFVATNMGTSRTGADASLYVFPDAPGESVEPFPSERTPTPTSTPAVTPTATPTPTDSPTATATEPPTGTPSSPTPDTTTTDTTSPGFGVLGTLGALGAGSVLRYKRQLERE